MCGTNHDVNLQKNSEFINKHFLSATSFFENFVILTENLIAFEHCTQVITSRINILSILSPGLFLVSQKDESYALVIQTVHSKIYNLCNLRTTV